MIRKKIKLLTIFIVSVTLIVIPEVFAQTSSTPNNPTQLPSNLFSNSGFLENIIVAILSGILAFLSGYVLSGIESKRGTTDKKLSYNLSIENGIIQIDKNVRKRVKVFYDSEEIDNLYDIKFYLENIGNQVIKSEEIRFRFPEETRILDFSFDPEPVQEMKVERIETDLKSFEKKIRIGQIEKNQTINIRFTATNDKVPIQEENLKLYPYNAEGDVGFESRIINKALSDKEKTIKFLSLYIFYIIIPPIFYGLPFIGDAMASVVRFFILLSLFRFIGSFSDVISDVIYNLRQRGKKDAIYNFNAGRINNLTAGENNSIMNDFHESLDINDINDSDVENPTKSDNPE